MVYQYKIPKLLMDPPIPRNGARTSLRQDVLKRYLLSRIALRLLEIIEPYLVKQNRMANAQLLGYGSKHLGQNFFFY